MMQSYERNNNMSQENIHDYPPVLSVADLMKLLNIGKNTAYMLVRDGIIPGVKVGRQFRILKSAVIDYLAGK